MYLDKLPAIAAGRELSAFPKKLGSARLFVGSDTLVGTLDYGTLRVAIATTGYKHKPLDLEKRALNARLVGLYSRPKPSTSGSALRARLVCRPPCPTEPDSPKSSC